MTKATQHETPLAALRLAANFAFPAAVTDKLERALPLELRREPAEADVLTGRQVARVIGRALRPDTAVALHEPSRTKLTVEGEDEHDKALLTELIGSTPSACIAALLATKADRPIAGWKLLFLEDASNLSAAVEITVGTAKGGAVYGEAPATMDLGGITVTTDIRLNLFRAALATLEGESLAEMIQAATASRAAAEAAAPRPWEAN